MHHITKARNSLRPVPPKIPVDAWVGDAVVETVDDVVTEPLLRSLLAIVLSDADRLDALWVLVATETYGES
jgi:hypothetical protein